MLTHLLLLSLFLFSVGLYGLLTRKSVVGLFISIELMLNAGIINIVGFNRVLYPEGVDGQVMALFAMALAAAEVLVGLAILVMIFRHQGNTDINSLHELKH